MLDLMLTAALNIQGAWFKPCEETPDHHFIQQQLYVWDRQWVRDTRYNTKFDCSGSDYLETRQVFKVSASEPKLDLETAAFYYAALSPEAAAELNAIQFCGFNDWRAQAPRNVTGMNCGGTQLPEKGHITYSIYRLQPRNPRDLLWVGEATRNADGTAPDKRHITFELYAFERERDSDLK